MQNSPISFDLTKYLKALEKRLSVVENRRPGTIYLDKKIVAKDPETGVETIIGNLEEYGEDRVGIKQWVNDTEPPAIPVMPIVTSNLGVFSVIWSGFFKDDAPMAPDFSHLNVYGNNGTSTKLVGVIKTKDEVAIVTSDSEAMYDEVWSFWFTSVDQVGNESLPGEISAGNKLTPLVEAPDMVKIFDEIDVKFGGVITEAQQLNDKLAQAELDIDNAQAGLTNLETVRLPAVEANIEAAHQEIVTTGAELDARLDQAETDLNAAETGLNNLKNTELPAVKAQIESVHQELVTTGGQLDARLDQAETDIATAETGLNTLKNTDLPALNQRLSNAETEITTTGQQLDARLDDAFIQIGTVDAKAVANATAASNAQSAADAANSAASAAAGIANGKGKVLVQSTAPGSADRNAVTLWIDTTGGANTPKRWTSGTTWVAVTDKVAVDAAQAAVNAQSKADAAHTAAGNAQTTANNALTMAGSKNSVFYSANAPSGTANTGDTWRQVNAKGDVIAEWRWTAGGSWLSQQVTTEMISNLDVGKLTAGTANISDLVVEKLWAEVIRAKKITADQLLVGSGTNLIVDPYLEDATVKAARASLTNLSGGYGRNATNNLNWFGGTQTAGTVQTYYFSTINSRTKTDSMIPIVEGSKYRFKFLYNSVGGGARPVASVVRKDGATAVTASGFITNGVATSGFGGAGSGQTMEAVWTPDPSWDYAYFVPGIQWESSVTSAHIYGGASVQDMTDGSLIVNGSIDADKINTNSIVAEVAKFIKLDVSSLIASNATINTAVIEKLWTDVIRSRKITTDQLLVGQGENLIPWDMVSTLDTARANISGYGSGSVQPSLQKGAGVADGDHMFMVADWVNPGSNTITWQLSNGSTAGGLTSRWTVEPEEELVFSAYVKAGGSYSGSMPGMRVAIYWYNGAGTNISNVSSSATPLTWSWQKLTIDGKAPATAAYALVYIRQDQPGGVRVDLPSLYRKKGASLIVDGSIAAKQIDSESVSAEVAKFINLDVSRLVATNATMNTAVVNKLWADVIRSRKITTDMLVVGSGGNHFPDPLLTDPDGWSSSSYIKTGVGRNSGNGLVVPASTGQSGTYYGSSDRLRQIPVIGGQEYRVGVWVKSSVAIPLNKVTIYVKYTTSSSTTSGSFAPNIQNTGVDGRLGVVPANTWRFLEGITKMPDTAEQAFIGLYAESGFNAAVTFSEPSVQTAAGTGLIVENGIQAKHIEASESMSAKIGQFLKLDVKDLISTGTAKLNDAVIDKLWTDVVHSKKITSDMVVIGGTNNLIPNANVLTDLAGWEDNSVSTLKRTVGTSFPYMYATTAGNIRSAIFEVIGGGRYRFSIKAQAAATGSRFYVQVNTNGTSNPYPINGQTLTTGWVDYSGEIDMPADATTAYINIYVNHSSGSVTTQRFAGVSLVQMASGELVVDGAITATKIKTNAVESDKIKANAITADKIAVGAIKAEHISARGITADKIVVGDGSNVFPDSFMKDLDSWNAANAVTVYTGGYGGGNRARVNGTTGQNGGYYAFGTGLEGRRPDVIPGRTYLVSCYVRPTVAVSSTNAIALYSRVYKKGDPHTASYSFTSPSVVYNGKALAANVWTEISGQITIPAGDETSFMPGLYLQSTFPSTGACDFSMYTLTEMVTGELVVGGAITGTHIKASTITASNIAANTITGSKIAANTITAGNIATNAITANELAANAVKAENIAADAITGKTITGGKVIGTTLQTNTDVNKGVLIRDDLGVVSRGTNGARSALYNGQLVVHGAGGGSVQVNADSTATSIYFSNDSGSAGGFTSFNNDFAMYPPTASGRAQPKITMKSLSYDMGGATMEVDAETIELSPRGDAVVDRPTTIQSGILGDSNDIYVKGRRLKLYGGEFLKQADLVLNNDSTSPYVQSTSTYDRTYSGSAAMCITGSGVFGRTTSALKYKEDVALIDPESYEDALLSIEHKSWVDKGEATRYREYLAWEADHPMQPIPHEMLETPTSPPKRHYGAIADEFHDAGLEQFVIYDPNGEVDGLAYERIGVALIPIVRKQRDEIEDLKSRLALLEAKVDGSHPQA